MAEPTATLVATHTTGKGLAKSFETSHNHGKFTFTPDARAAAMPGKAVYIYNVLNWEHTVNRGLPYAKVVIPACPEGQKVSAPFTLPAYVNIPQTKLGTYEIYSTSVDGRHFAADICNPYTSPAWQAGERIMDANPSADDNAGTNLYGMGVFWTQIEPDDPALDPLIARAKARAEKYLNQLVAKAKLLEGSGKIGEISDWMRFAARYFNLTTAYNQVYKHQVSCPKCGEAITAGVAYHRNSFGDKCIIDWQAAYSAGAVKKDDVPEEFRWWGLAPVQPAEPEPDANVEPKSEGKGFFGNKK
jgi:hypothetical protein